MSFFERWRNHGTGTYDGTRMLADLSGLSLAEVRWTAARTQELVAEGKTREQVQAVIKLEALRKPWLPPLPTQPDEWR